MADEQKAPEPAKAKQPDKGKPEDKNASGQVAKEPAKAKPPKSKQPRATEPAKPKFMSAREALKARAEGVSRKQARRSIHPSYVACRIVCGCGNVVETRAAVPEIQVGICSNCHPFFTGAQKFVDAAGRVEKFQRRYQWSAAQALEDNSEGAGKQQKNIGRK